MEGLGAVCSRLDQILSCHTAQWTWGQLRCRQSSFSQKEKAGLEIFSLCPVFILNRGKKTRKKVRLSYSPSENCQPGQILNEQEQVEATPRELQIIFVSFPGPHSVSDDVSTSAIICILLAQLQTKVSTSQDAIPDMSSRWQGKARAGSTRSPVQKPASLPGN